MKGVTEEARAELLGAIDGLESLVRGIPAVDGDPQPPPPDPEVLRVYYWNGSHRPDTFGHSSGVAMCRHGGAGTIRTYYEQEQGLWRPGTGKFKRDGEEAAQDGCIAWVWDIEILALFELSPSEAAAGIEEVRRSGIPVGLAPKIGFGHFHSWRGRRTWNMNARDATGWAIDSGVEIISDWHYARPGPVFVDTFQARESWGFQGQQIAIMEPRRHWDGNRPATRADVEAVFNSGFNIGWFAPPAWRGQPIDYSGSEGMRRARDLYD